MRPAVCAHRRAGSFAVLLAVVSLTLSACGSSKPSGTDADPAMLAPSSSVLYLSGVVRGQGAFEQNAIKSTRVFGIRKPFDSIFQSFAASSPLGRFGRAQGIEPWVGSNVGVFTTAPSALSGVAHAIEQNVGGAFSPEALLQETAAGALGAPGSASALVLDTRDLGAARAFVAQLARKQSAHTVRYHSLAFHVDADGHAEGIVGKFAVFGNEAGLKAAIDAHRSGSSLASKGTPYAQLAAKGPSGALAGLYLNPHGEQAQSLLQALPGEPKQVRISMVPQSSSPAVDVDQLSSAAAEAKAASAAAAAANLVASLPPNLSIALGVGEAGAHAARYLTLIRSLVSIESRSLLASFGGPALSRLLERLSARQQALQRLFGGWTGPAALFARGSGLQTQAALVIEASSQQAAHAAVAKLGAMLAAAGASVSHTAIPAAESALSIRVPGLPVSLDVGAGNGRLVIGLGPESVHAALAPGLPESHFFAYRSYVSLAGGKPIAIVAFTLLVLAVESFGLNENPAFARTLYTLHVFDTLAGTVQPLGDGVTRLHIGLVLANAARPRPR